MKYSEYDPCFATLQGRQMQQKLFFISKNAHLMNKNVVPALSGIDTVEHFCNTYTCFANLGQYEPINRITSICVTPAKAANRQASTATVADA
jgi:hypothetical protein